MLKKIIDEAQNGFGIHLVLISSHFEVNWYELRQIYFVSIGPFQKLNAFLCLVLKRLLYLYVHIYICISLPYAWSSII